MENKIEQILNSLDGVGRAEASPYLYSKIRNRMEAASPLPKTLAWRIAVVLLVVGALNLYTLSAFSGHAKAGTVQASTIAAEYSLSLPADY